MSKLEEKVNEILGIEKEVEKVEKEFKPLVPRTEDDKKKTLIMITNIVEKITIT